VGGWVRDRLARSKATPAGEGLVVEIDDKLPERARDAESWEETNKGRVEPP